MDIEKPPTLYGAELSELNDWLEKFWLKLQDEDIRVSATWDAVSIADGDEEDKDVTVTGAVLGDYAIASLSIDVADLVLDAQVTTADTVTCVLANNTGAAVDLAEGTIYVRLIKRTT